MFQSSSDLAIPAAIEWLQAVLLGSAATFIATIAVASIGYLAFMGRVDVRRSLQLILGCFILFGAPTIAAGLTTIASRFSAEPEPLPPPVVVAPPILLKPPTPPANQPAYDPYAGAAIAPK